MTPQLLTVADLTARVLKRPQGELFLRDLEANRDLLLERIQGRRALLIGGAGSIGSATLKELMPFQPGSVHVVDQSENELAELVRDLRSRPEGLEVEDFRALPLDFGSPLMERVLREGEGYDLILNFAALKHVRSEKDVPSLLQMVDTNVLKLARFLGWWSESGEGGRVFSVSTDKAANPVSLMGATKKAMEHVLFSTSAGDSWATSARFANVAFSRGSLLESFLRRLAARQPLAAPRDTRRYFLSLAEAGRLCLLAAVAGPDRTVLVPDLSRERHEEDLETVAVRVLEAHGWKARVYQDEAEARKVVDRDLASGVYPLLLTERDTSGEKAQEEFTGVGEHAEDVGFAELKGIPGKPPDGTRLMGFLEAMETLIAHPERVISKQEVVERLRELVPEMEHLDTGQNLDQRM